MLQRVCACSIALLLVSAASGDTLLLKSGRRVDGTYLGGNSRQIRVDTGNNVETFSITDVESIRFGDMDAPPSNRVDGRSQGRILRPEQDSAPIVPNAPAPTSPSSVATAPMTSVESAPARRDYPIRRNGAVEVPAGTPIAIRLIDDVDSERDTTGKTYRASVDESVMVDGVTAIPKGADVMLRLVEDKQSGRLTGKTELTLDVDTIAVNGRNVEVATETVTQASSSRTTQTAKVAGGTAALGAIIGAIAGGGKGAAIGALGGAAAGGAVQVMTKGLKVKIPSETRLTFSLERPVRI